MIVPLLLSVPLNVGLLAGVILNVPVLLNPPLPVIEPPVQLATPALVNIPVPSTEPPVICKPPPLRLKLASAPVATELVRSEERRVGKERRWWMPPNVRKTTR